MDPKLEVKGNKVTIEFDPDSTTRSKSGKSVILATSHGFLFREDVGINYNIIKKT